MPRYPRNMGYLEPPTPEDLRRLAPRDFLDLSREEAEILAAGIAGMLQTLDEVEDLPELLPPVRHGARDPGRRPTREEDPLNAFVRVCRIEGAPGGPLAGRTVGIKDNIAVAGIPISNGSRALSYTPGVDAVVVERILDAGATIVGKTNLDDLSASDYGDTSAFGAPRNALRPTHSPGGSSGGSGAAVAGGLVDLAVGVDQGGSVRMPAAANGVVGLKATSGLIPSFGVTYMDHTLDSIGPIARTVREVAELLAVLAGDDWRDPQWVRGEIALDDYLAGVEDGARGLRVGVLRESLDPALCEPEVLDGVYAAADALERAGAHVDEASIPLWRHGFAIWAGVLLSGLPLMLRSNGAGYPHLGYIDVGRVHAAGVARRAEAHLLPPTIKMLLLASSYLDDRYMGVPVARAHNQRLALRRAIDEALERRDVLLTPTTPRVAVPLAEGRVTQAELMSRAFPETIAACPVNASGHPALAVPSGLGRDGLPTSVQVVGRRFGERRVLTAGAAIERALSPALQKARAAR
ncbi:amidase family protein [Sorangium sp. So ce131]|uniref:amidase family protein n=1 Tax=Sorangium sp. So ce131 TaxID=3133282 RepID=UPI003F5F350C